ncbi:hypothetical protein V6N13_057955 [Hibiscus sabdariffa]|uniref:Uncharacterized protein n=1 Tax=Hibiscus sabdariffa TaxID=183260 RepID=A0ABR2GHN8_9ROSI
MKGRSSKQGIGRNRKSKQEPHLSAAYVRSLVKRLTSSRCAKDPESVGAGGFHAQNLTKFGGGFSGTPQRQSQQSEPPPPPPPPPQQHRKQVRRRVHTSRPYQERLINMAEARREIVTALKFHRAAMKQATEQQQPHPFDSSLPSQTLGLNLNFHCSNTMETDSTSSSSTLSVVTEEYVPSVAASHEPRHTTESYGGGSLHQAVDDEGLMAEMRSLGEQHQMEWNDTMNLVTSAWWFKFDQAMEFPAWLNANDSVLQQHFNHLFPDSCFQFQSSALPCMDMGEIDGNDGDWHWLA